ncbi:MAG: YheU family protein [Deltaproteobacteria bacterium]|jgi:uncharacterized protein YheU (UPF0270 family)|nr:YheU family protein [Deltaproteobacteria bacterium]
MKPNPQEKIIDHQENGVDVPYDQIDPETLRNMIQEFVTRDGADWGEPGCALEDKIAQVMKQLKNKQVKVVFDLNSKTANIVPCL